MQFFIEKIEPVGVHTGEEAAEGAIVHLVGSLNRKELDELMSKTTQWGFDLEFKKAAHK